MSKYKSLTEPITRREACLILERKQFDSAVRAGRISPIGKQGADGEVDYTAVAALTAPLLFLQEEVRTIAADNAVQYTAESKLHAATAKALGRTQPPLTRRQIAALFGKRLTGILIRSGRIVPDGALTDTQTAAHTYDPIEVSSVANDLAEQYKAEAVLAARGAKTRIPA
ncbi:hypothetical protein [Ilumatobacter sp.]|uniref:hypothetical protein n=1 Tax=Ilumatobacter sp. TaxID=1967498 RepID=UPI0037537F02